jgi:hypothetical protein
MGCLVGKTPITSNSVSRPPVNPGRFLCLVTVSGSEGSQKAPMEWIPGENPRGKGKKNRSRRARLSAGQVEGALNMTENS